MININEKVWVVLKKKLGRESLLPSYKKKKTTIMINTIVIKTERAC